ncbi:hypothetical protein [Streptomyces sp. NPDC055992]|uniref:hypothetical protein n=1 Tax=Streptomyces sp. NPDC055992 TaxID=3345673 RepID=UPI0035DC8AA1
MSTSPDLPGPLGGNTRPPSPGGQYVGWGTALYGATAQHITINTSFLPSEPHPQASPAAPPFQDPRLLKVLMRLEGLLGRLVVIAERAHTTADHLAALLQPDGGASAPSGRRRSGELGPERPRRGA